MIFNQTNNNAGNVTTVGLRNVGLTEAERSVLERLAAAWMAFRELPAQHPDDNDEFRYSIHALQNIIAWRVARRVNPEDWS